MKDKQEILLELQSALQSGVITQDDIKPFITPQPELAVPAPQSTELKSNSEKLSAVDAMFYIAGFVFFATIMSVIVQSWEDGSALVHILLSAGIGTGLWGIVYYLLKSPFQNDVRRGLTNALLLTGSLQIIVGGYIVTNELIGGFNEVNYIPGAIALATLGALHLTFDRLIKRDLTLLLGIVLAVAAFPALVFGILADSNVPMDVWSVVAIVSVLLLAYATRVVAKVYPDRQNIKDAFDSLAAFGVLLSMYVSNFGDYGVAWLCALIASVLGIFYLSIVSQNKQLLGSASFFMVLTVITISFKYFSGFGATVSLVVATLGLLGSAAVAASINKKYFKETLKSA